MMKKLERNGRDQRTQTAERGNLMIPSGDGDRPEPRRAMTNLSAIITEEFKILSIKGEQNRKDKSNAKERARFWG
jgi:hypothetical protein